MNQSSEIVISRLTFVPLPTEISAAGTTTTLSYCAWKKKASPLSESSRSLTSRKGEGFVVKEDAWVPYRRSALSSMGTEYSEAWDRLLGKAVLILIAISTSRARLQSHAARCSGSTRQAACVS